MNRIVHVIPSRCCRHLCPDIVSRYTVIKRCQSVLVRSGASTAELCSKYRLLSLLNHCSIIHKTFCSGGFLVNTKLSGFHTSSKINHFFVAKPRICRNATLLQSTLVKPTIVKLQSCSYGTSELQKHLPSLSAKRPTRKKILDGKPVMIPLTKKRKDDVLSVTAYGVAEEIYLPDFQKKIEQQGLYEIQYLPIDVTDALFVRARYKVAVKPREIFFFTEGTAVFWNVPAVEQGEILKFMRQNSTHVYDVELQEHEHMGFKYVSSETSLHGDTIYLSDTETDEVQLTLEKYAFSNALSQSVKLDMWESALEKIAALLEPVTAELRYGRKIRMSRRDVLQRTGELFSLRHSINLSSDLLDTPDFYWDRAGLEPLYMRASNHLNIQRRTKVMNEKLSHCCELTELLSSHLNDVHHVRLEWMIIILIMVEVVFEIVHYAERYMLEHKYEAVLEKEL